MLKIEKNLHNSNFKVRFSDRKRHFNRPLIIALSIALTIHCLCWFIFTIAPIKLNFPDYLPPPITVEAEDLSTKNQVPEYVYAGEIEQRQIARRSLIEPVKTRMTFPKPALTKIEDHLNISSNSILDDPPGIRSQLLLNTESLITFEMPQSTISIYGSLANHPLANKNPNENETLIKFTANTLVEYRTVFNVLMSCRNGRIIWFQVQENALPPKILGEAEAILKKMQFKKIQSDAIKSGIIEITIRVNF